MNPEICPAGFLMGMISPVAQKREPSLRMRQPSSNRRFAGDTSLNAPLGTDGVGEGKIAAYLEAFTYTSIGRSAAMMMVLWLITNVLSTIFIKQWLRLRARAHGAA